MSVTLPDADFVARTCRPSSLDPLSGRPTPASFEFRLGKGQWETFLSVNWLEFLHREGGLAERLTHLRAFLRDPPPGVPVLPPKKSMLLAVIPVRAIHAAALIDVGTTLTCRHAPDGDGDPHSGVYPNPRTHCWPQNHDAPAHLAVKQHLFMAVCHCEPAVV